MQFSFAWKALFSLSYPVFQPERKNSVLISSPSFHSKPVWRSSVELNRSLAECPFLFFSIQWKWMKTDVIELQKWQNSIIKIGLLHYILNFFERNRLKFKWSNCHSLIIFPSGVAFKSHLHFCIFTHGFLF